MCSKRYSFYDKVSHLSRMLIGKEVYTDRPMRQEWVLTRFVDNEFKINSQSENLDVHFDMIGLATKNGTLKEGSAYKFSCSIDSKLVNRFDTLTKDTLGIKTVAFDCLVISEMPIGQSTLDSL